MDNVAPSVPILRWAATRARLSDETLSRRFGKWAEWLTGEAQPTLRQLEEFARVSHTAIGYFFLAEPPSLDLPVPDFRTVGDAAVAEPSTELLDVLFLCQQRQDWYREYARLNRSPPLAFVGSAGADDSPLRVAARMREVLKLSTEERRAFASWSDALRQLIAKSEDAGALVMASSIVGSNSHRKLDVAEFRGFALADELAPVVFLNSGDSKAAQMFTLAHELAHLWLGASGISDVQAGQVPEQKIERWCNQVAAELLVPMDAFRTQHRQDEPVSQSIQRLARHFKVSTLVVLRRLFDAGYVDKNALWRHYRDEIQRLSQLERSGAGGGDFYRTLGARVSKRFARAIVSSALEGQSSFTEAFRMLGIRRTTTFYAAARELGVAA